MSRGKYVSVRKKQNVGTGSQIKALREKLGMNQTAFAFALGTRPSTVSKWESDHNRPSPDVFVRLAKIADGAEKLFFLEEAGLPPSYFYGEKMLPEIKEASTRVVSRALGAVAEKEILWDRELLTFVIQTVNHELKKRERQLSDRKYATLVALFYELCQQTGKRDSAMMDELLKQAS
jgi:transcriptional regulator with XRE-family HTH domain